MRKAGGREYRQLLAANEGVQAVYRGNAGLDKFRRVGARRRVHGHAVNVAVSLGKKLRAAVYGLTHAVEHAAEHILGNGKLQRMTEESYLRLREVYALRRVEKLNDRSVTLDLEYLAAACLSVLELDLAQLVIGDALDLLDDHKGICYLPYGLIIFNHASSPPAMTASISVFICSRMEAYSCL